MTNTAIVNVSNAIGQVSSMLHMQPHDLLMVNDYGPINLFAITMTYIMFLLYCVLIVQRERSRLSARSAYDVTGDESLLLFAGDAASMRVSPHNYAADVSALNSSYLHKLHLNGISRYISPEMLNQQLTINDDGTLFYSASYIPTESPYSSLYMWNQYWMPERKLNANLLFVEAGELEKI